MLASFVRSRYGKPLLVHRDHVYLLNRKSNNRKHFWFCVQRRPHACKGNALTLGSTCDDVTSIVVKATGHTHPPSPASVKVYDAVAHLRRKALESDASALTLRQQLFTAVEPEVAALLPSVESMTRCINRWRNNRERVALTHKYVADEKPAK